MSLSGKPFAGPLYEDLELWYPKIRLEDGKLISSRTPADLPQFMRALISALAGR
jgi:hypothetical protein